MKQVFPTRKRGSCTCAGVGFQLFDSCARSAPLMCALSRLISSQVGCGTRRELVGRRSTTWPGAPRRETAPAPQRTRRRTRRRTRQSVKAGPGPVARGGGGFLPLCRRGGRGAACRGERSGGSEAFCSAATGVKRQLLECIGFTYALCSEPLLNASLCINSSALCLFEGASAAAPNRSRPISTHCHTRLCMPRRLSRSLMIVALQDIFRLLSGGLRRVCCKRELARGFAQQLQ